MIQKSSRHYTYMYSENYQNIERLLALSGKTIKTKATSREFVILDELSKRKVEKTKKVDSSDSDMRDPYVTRKLRDKRSRP